MIIERWSHLAAVVPLLALAYAGTQLLAQQPAPALPVPTPESLSIPEQPPPAPPAAVLQNYPVVTAERLRHPSDAEWLMVRRTYDGWGYSPLEQINTANVTRLQPGLGHVNGHEQRRRRLRPSSTAASCSCRRPITR